MKMAMVIAHPPAFTETFIATEVRGLTAAGADVVLIPMSQAELPVPSMNAEDLDARQRSLQAPNFSQSLILLLQASLRAPMALRYLLVQNCLPRRTLLWQALCLAWTAKQLGVTHLHAHYADIAPYAILAARLLGMSCSFAGHGYDIYKEQPTLGPELENADLVIAVCEAVKSEFLRQAPTANIEVVHCGVNISDFHPASGTARSGFIVVANLIEKKGIDTVLRAFSQLDQARRGILQIVGRGPLRGELQTLAEDLGLQASVKFHGLQPHRRVRELMSQTRALVLTARVASDGDRDSAPIVCKEALASGLPIIVSSVVGLPEIVSNDCGFLLSPDDINATLAAMQSILEMDEQRWKSYSKSARQRAEHLFDAERLCAQLLLRFEALQ